MQFNGNLKKKKRKFSAIFLKKKSSFWQFFDSQMAIFRKGQVHTSIGFGLRLALGKPALKQHSSVNFTALSTVSVTSSHPHTRAVVCTYGDWRHNPAMHVCHRHTVNLWYILCPSIFYNIFQKHSYSTINKDIVIWNIQS